MLSDDERGLIKDKLRAVVGDVRDEIRRLEEAVRPIPPDDAIGRLTRMEAINAKNVSEANLRSALARLAGIERAIERADEPDFGECAECGETIPMKRLLLVPGTTRCVRCMDR